MKVLLDLVLPHIPALWYVKLLRWFFIIGVAKIQIICIGKLRTFRSVLGMERKKELRCSTKDTLEGV
jgi:hypothetical protein